MKRALFFGMIASCTINCTIYAQAVVTLHNNGTTQHFSGAGALINAYTNSLAGDTIYLPGGSFLPPPGFDKGLHIYGAGHYPDSTMASGKTFINGTITLNENADNFHLEGVEVNGSINFNNNASVNQVTIKYCKVNVEIAVSGNLNTPSNNIAIINSVLIGDVLLNNATNVAIYNSIIQKHITNSVGNQFYNNVILFSTQYGSDYFLNGDAINNNLYNNIFPQNFPYTITAGSGNNYKYNLFNLASPDLGYTYVSVNNYFGVPQSSIFVNQSGSGFDYTHNYHLLVPEVYPGSDNTVIGIYGGYFPYKEGAVPSNPHIRSKTIAPATDAQGKLNVLINVAAQDK